MPRWLSHARSVLTSEVDEIRRGHLDLDPADLTRFTFPLLVRAVGVLAVGAVPLLVIRSSDETDEVLVPLLGSVALTMISTAVVAWAVAIVFSGLVLVVVYRTPPHAASRLVITSLMTAFRRISDSTTLLVLLALVAGVVALAIGLPSRRDREAAYSMVDDLLAAQIGVLLVALALAFMAEAIRGSAELVDYKSLLLAWPWALGICGVSWTLVATTGPFQSTRMLTRLLIDWLPGTVGGRPQEEVIAEVLPSAAHWWAGLAGWPIIILIWVIEAQRHNGFHQMRQFIGDTSDTDDTDDIDDADDTGVTDVTDAGDPGGSSDRPVGIPTGAD